MKSESFFALIAGAAAGLAAGLLLAPESGEETRKKVKSVAEDGLNKASARARLARMDLKDLQNTLKDEAADLKEDVRAKVLEQLDKLEKALQKEEAIIEEVIDDQTESI